MSRFQTRTGTRLRWRVIVRSSGQLDPSRGVRSLAWHLVECAGPTLLDAHCPQGRQLLSDGQDPDGHCLIDEVCMRCEDLKPGPELVAATG